MLRRLLLVATSVVLVATSVGTSVGSRASTVRAAASRTCISGAHTLSKPGDHVYPELGNGGYRSVRTVVHLVYDAPSNRFLRGNHVTISSQAQHCLHDFSLDFERHSPDKVTGPDLKIRSITVDGKPATWRFVRPTYPGDPKGRTTPATGRTRPGRTPWWVGRRTTRSRPRAPRR